MKRFIKYSVLAALLCLLPLGLHAQQEEKCADCIVSGALETLPAENADVFNAAMESLASLGGESVRALVSMLAPPEEGQNALYEYALNGLVAYVSAPGREAEAAEVKDAILDSVGECEGKSNQAFLLTLVRLLAGPEDFDSIAAYLDDEYLGPFAVSDLASIPDIDDKILALIKKSKTPSAGLAALAAAKGISGAEKYLLKWIPSNDVTLRRNVYTALGVCGSEKSLVKLGSVAYADNYALGNANASEAYFRLLRRLVESGSRKAFETAKDLLDNKITVAKTNAFDILFHSGKLSGKALVLAALKDEDREYRRAALFEADEIADEELYASVAALLPDLDNEARTDIVSWLGERHAASQTAAVLEAVGSGHAPLAVAAIRAAGKIGGEDALKVLVDCLDGPHAIEAETALESFPGSIRETVIALIDSPSPLVQAVALRLASRRHVTETFDRALELTSSQDPQVSAVAYGALAGICTPEDFDRLCALLDSCPEEAVSAVQNAAGHAGTDVEYEALSAKVEASPCSERYYPLLASCGNAGAVETLEAAAREGSEDAFAALLRVDADIASVLLELAGTDSEWKDMALFRACDLVGKYIAPSDRIPYYVASLEMEPSSKVTVKLLNALGESGSPDAVGIAIGYTDYPETAEAAAYAVKSVISANPGLLGDEAYTAALLKAREVYAALSVGDPDAGYAVDEINLLLSGN
ncbi:MAG: HEAT repeat domain-containing protein [Bacteroidales bacterium]|nr:HEAT repeat domain-containing protein [Bacteroidales bacterium]